MLITILVVISSGRLFKITISFMNCILFNLTIHVHDLTISYNLGFVLITGCVFMCVDNVAFMF